MAETSTSEIANSKSPPRRRRRLILLGLFVLLVVVSVGLFNYYYPEWDLQAAIAETDRLDPGWRLEDMQKARAEISDEDNGALLVLAAAAVIPASWSSEIWAATSGVGERLLGLAPRQPPEPQDLKKLRGELAKASAALGVARQLADRPIGRYAIKYADDYLSTLLPQIQQARELSNFLALDALSQSIDGNIEGALRSCQAAINAGRSIGDEPAFVCALIRVGCVRQGILALEFALARGEASEKSLETLQQLLAEEAATPLQLLAARSLRIANYKFLTFLSSGSFQRAKLGLVKSTWSPITDRYVYPGLARNAQSAYLRYCNRIVEVSKLPTDVQAESLRGLVEPETHLPDLFSLFGIKTERWLNLTQYFHRAIAEQRCAQSALAAERYRLRHGKWPAKLEDLAPHYLASVPVNPFTGKALILKTLPDGLVIYAPRPNDPDYHDNLMRGQAEKPGTLIGFQLWDPRVRSGKAAK